MVDSSKICLFVQSTDSCVLGSYGIAANFFTGIAIRKFFDDYCRHYEISNFNMHKYLFGPSQITPEKLSEFAYDSHFHEACKNSGTSGFEFIKKLHDHSGQISFQTSRMIFQLQYYHDQKYQQEREIIQEELEHNDALLIAAFNKGSHIAVFGFHHNKGMFTVETRPSNNPGIHFISSIQEYCAVGDALKASRILKIGYTASIAAAADGATTARRC